jgi:hypothetical protein
MISFGQALEKLSFKLNQKGKQEVKAERHFETSDPNWNEFVKNLKSKHFQEAVKGHPQADEKLQAYVENFGGYLRSKDHVATLKSKDSGKNYRIKKVGKRLGCNCGDWQYRHSVQGGDCKHIQSLKKSKMLKTAGLPGALLTVYKYPELLGPDAKKHKKKIEKKVDEVLVPLELAKEAFVHDLLTAAATVSAMNAAAERKKRHGQAAAMNAKQLKAQQSGVMG